jgi:hypothetical protein
MHVRNNNHDITDGTLAGSGPIQLEIICNGNFNIVNGKNGGRQFLYGFQFQLGQD